MRNTRALIFAFIAAVLSFSSLTTASLQDAIDKSDAALNVSTVSATENEQAVLMLEYRGGLIGPSSVPVNNDSDTMSIPVQHPIDSGEVGVSGRLQFQTGLFDETEVTPEFNL